MKLRIRIIDPEELAVGQPSIVVGIRVNEDTPKLIRTRPGILEYCIEEEWHSVPFWVGDEK